MPTRNPNRTRNAVIAIVAVLLLAMGAFKPVSAPLKRLVANAAAPAYAAGAGISRAAARLFDSSEKDKAALESQIDQLRIENAKLRELAVENGALKTAIGYSEKSGLKPLTARVISESDEDVFHGLVIDRGADDGVKPDQPVVVGEGIVIGKIFETKAGTASVLLLSDSRSRLAVTVQSSSGTAGVLEGDRGLSMTINLIPQTVTLSPGDTVVTSGIEAGIRRGLAVGVIDKVVQHTQDPFQSATVLPFDSAAHPPFVQVLTGDVGADGEKK